MKSKIECGQMFRRLSLVLSLMMSASAFGENADGHAAHHPESAPATTTSADEPTNTSVSTPPFPPAMDPQVMGQMMERMGVPAPKNLYPTLMSIPPLSEETPEAATAMAVARMEEGTALMAEAFAALREAVEHDDLTAMQAAADRLQQGISRYQSGTAARRALREGQAPRAIALRWFKSEMNLIPMAAPGEQPFLFGMSVFHTSIMAIILMFALSAGWMYIFKMRRAANLLAGLVEGRTDVEDGSFHGVLTHPRDAPGAQNPTTPLSRRETWVGTLSIIGVFDETPGVKTFRLAMPDGSPLPFSYEPGQFATLTLHPDNSTGEVKRSYTIASSPSQRDYIELTIKREPEGQGSRYLHDTQTTGSKLQLQAPLGRFYFNGTQSDSIVLMAGGIGITPMMSVLRYLTAHCWSGEIYLLYGVNTPADIVFGSEIEQIKARHDNVHVYICVDRPGDSGWTGATGRLEKEVIQSFVPGIIKRRVHICGPPAMMDATKSALLALSVPADAIKLEVFGAVAKPGISVERPIPVAAETAETATFDLSFTRTGRNTTIAQNQTVLDAADAVGVQIDRSCLAGTCGTCIVHLSSGTVVMDVDDALEPAEKEAGYILACQARPTSNIAVDA